MGYMLFEITKLSAKRIVYCKYEKNLGIKQIISTDELLLPYLFDQHSLQQKQTIKIAITKEIRQKCIGSIQRVIYISKFILHKDLFLNISFLDFQKNLKEFYQDKQIYFYELSHIFALFLKSLLFNGQLSFKNIKKMILALHKNQLYQQLQEANFPRQAWKAQQYIQAINCNKILYFSKQFRKNHNPSMKQIASRPKLCRTMDFLVQIRKLITLNSDYKLLRNKTISFYYEIAQRLIVPLKEKMEEWENSGICPGCKSAYDAWSINFYIILFKRVIQGEIAEQHGPRVLLYNINQFQIVLNHFESVCNCISNPKIK